MNIQPLNEKEEKVKQLLEEKPDMTSKEIAAYLNISHQKVNKIRRVLGLSAYSSYLDGKKNKENIKKLLEENPTMMSQEISKYLNIDIRVVNSHRKSLGLSMLTNKSIGEKQRESIKLLLEDNPDISSVKIAELLNISSSTVNNHRKALGLSVPSVKDVSERQRESIKTALDIDPTLTNAEIARRLNIHKGVVSKHRKALNSQSSLIRKEAKENRKKDIELLKGKNPDITIKEIAEILHISTATVKKYLATTRIPINHEENKNNIKLLMEMIPNITNKELARRLNIDVQEVIKMRKILGLSASSNMKNRVERQKEAVKTLIEENPNIKTIEIASRLKMSRDTIARYRKDLNLNKESVSDKSLKRKSAILDVADAYPDITPHQISDLLDISVMEASKQLRKLNLAPISKRFRDSKNKQIVRKFVDVSPDINAVEISNMSKLDIKEVEKHLESLKSGKSYTEVQYEYNKESIRKLLEDKPYITTEEIEKQLKIRKYVISEIRRELGYGIRSDKSIVEEKLKIVIDLVEENPNITTVEIAQILDVSKGRAGRYRQIIGKSAPSNRTISELNYDSVERLVTKNPDISVKEIANQLNMHVTSVYTYLRRIRENE